MRWTARLLVGGAVYALLLGGTEAGLVLPALRVITGLLALACIAIAIRTVRNVDSLDIAALGATVLFAVTGITSVYPRASFDASLAALGWCSAFLVARRVAANPVARRLAMVAIGLVGGIIAIVFACLWGALWWRWLDLTSFTSWPPLTAGLPVVTFRHPNVIALTAVLLSPALVYMWRTRPARPFVVAALAATFFVAFASGSRTIWLAALVASIVTVTRAGWKRLRLQRRQLLSLGAIAGGVIAMAGISGLLDPLVTRIVTTATLSGRGELWQAAFGTFLAHPLTGSGPGTFAIGLSGSGFFSENYFPARHADNALIQAFSEGGIALGLSLVAFAAIGLRALWRGESRSALWAVTFFLACCATDNPTDTATLIAGIVFWGAVGTPRAHERSSPIAPTRAIRWTAAGLIALAASTQALFLAAQFIHTDALSAAARGQWEKAAADLHSAAALDPGNALYWRELGVMRLSSGNPSQALAPLIRARGLVPSDEVTLRGYAQAQWEMGNRSEAVSAVREGVSLHTSSRTMLLFAAGILSEEHRAQARDALVLAAEFDPLLPAAPMWNELFGETLASDEALAEAGLRIRSGDAPPVRLTYQVAWIRELTAGSRPEGFTPPPAGLNQTTEAFGALLRCRVGDSATLLEAAQTRESDQLLYWFLRLVVDRLVTGDFGAADRLASIAEPVAFGRIFAGGNGISPFLGHADDRRLYHMDSLSQLPGDQSVPAVGDGRLQWISDPIATARTVAPQLPLARCNLGGPTRP